MDYFDYGNPGARTRGSTNASSSGTPARRPLPGGSLESLRGPSSIRIRRLPSGQGPPDAYRPGSQQAPRTPSPEVTEETANRRRSFSAPQRYGANLAPPATNLGRQRTQDRPVSPQPQMNTITEGQQDSTQRFSDYYAGIYREPVETPQGESIPPTPAASEYYSVPASRVTTNASAMNDAGDAARRNRGLKRFLSSNSMAQREGHTAQDEYASDVVDLLDLVDPEVRTLGTLTNVQNSLFVPDLGSWLNRRPTYDLSRRPTSQGSRPVTGGSERYNRTRAGTAATRPDLPTTTEQPQQEQQATQDGIELQDRLERRMSISSDLNDNHYAVLPHGVSLEGWSEDDKAELNDHVRHLMHSRREGFKRSMRGFRQYISKPLGLFVFVYATLVTLFGAAWVFFLIGWIYVGPRQSYIINVVDNVLVALFALIGDGLAPFRAVDTYHMCFIAKYHHLTWSLRKKKNLPDLVDHNDLPDMPDRHEQMAAIEDAIDKEESAEFSVLKPRQQRRLQYHQAKFSKAHTFYRPHETATHHAFPLRLLVAVVVLLDCHSLFQVALGSCTWSWDYHTRPEALTATILSCSITCNIVAGILISVGDHRTRKKDVVERIFRQNLTQEALVRMQQKREADDAVARASIDPQLEAIVQDGETGAPIIPPADRPSNLDEEIKKAQ